MKHDFSDLSGKRFNRLTVIKDSGERSNSGCIRYLCLCDCGKETKVRGYDLKINKIQSCGCLNAELVKVRFIKHGQSMSGSITPEYHSWHGMIQRCFNPNFADYKNYGGRGITVCDRWLIFENFYDDMGSKPSSKHSLDRYPNNETGIYELSNCRWATLKEQSRNKRNNVWYEFNGERMILNDWAKRLKTFDSAMYKMMKRGKPFEKVVEYYTKKNCA